jgi:hypothetical protein
MGAKEWMHILKLTLPLFSEYSSQKYNSKQGDITFNIESSNLFKLCTTQACMNMITC